MYQEYLLREIRKKIGEKSLNDEIANILNISYDAAHRRSSSKAKFSFEEALELAKHYQISLDQFLGAENQMVVKRTQPIKTTNDLLSYFENSLKILHVFQENDNSQVYYSAKDIPFFYTISDSILSKFKFYVWMNLLNQDKFLSPFSEFSLQHHSGRNDALKEFYEQQNVTEIWNETTINSILQQVSFYHEIRMLNTTTVLQILEELQELITNLEQKTLQNPNFQIYVNDLVILNNSILFKNGKQSSYFLPFNMFGYIMMNDPSVCAETLSYFEHQIKNSKSLNTSGNRDRKAFFNLMLEKIEKLKELIKLK